MSDASAQHGAHSSSATATSARCGQCPESFMHVVGFARWFQLCSAAALQAPPPRAGGCNHAAPSWP
jgi:hypothetical protein